MFLIVLLLRPSVSATIVELPWADGLAWSSRVQYVRMHERPAS